MKQHFQKYNWRYWLSVACLLLLTSSSWGQLSVSGKVVDEKGATLPGVNVLLEGSNTGATTDADGTYRTTVPSAKSVLVFTFVGYTAERVTVGNKQTINVTLTADQKALDEVVVVGYGTQKKKDLTGAIGSVPIKDLENVPITRVDQMIQGRVSGVQVTQTNAAPGGNVSIRIRGTNSINSGNPCSWLTGFRGRAI